MTIQNLQTFIRYLTNTDSASLTDANLLIFINQEYERIVGNLIAETAGAIWQFGDINYTAFPTYTINLVDSQAEYDISGLITTTSEQTIAQTRPLTIMGVEVVDNNGNSHPLEPITLQDIRESGFGQPDYFETDGRPQYYEKREYMLVLYPAPDNGVTVTLSGGLRIFFLRTANIYTAAEVTTGTKQPGFPSPWHDALAYAVAYIVAMANGLPNINHLKNQKNEKEKELLRFISRNDQDNRHIMSGKEINYI